MPTEEVKKILLAKLQKQLDDMDIKYGPGSPIIKPIPVLKSEMRPQVRKMSENAFLCLCTLSKYREWKNYEMTEDEYNEMKRSYHEYEREFMRNLVGTYTSPKTKDLQEVWQCFLPVSIKSTRHKHTSPFHSIDYQMLLSDHINSNLGFALPEITFDGTRSDCLAVINDELIDFEVKRSLSDYLMDFNKTMRYNGLPVNKHIAYASGLTYVNKHYFVVQTGFLEEKEVPEHSGLIYFDPKVDYDSEITFKVIKKAPLLSPKMNTGLVWKKIAHAIAALVTPKSIYYRQFNYSTSIENL